MKYTKEINHNLFAMRQANCKESISDKFDNIICFATREIYEEGTLSSGSNLLAIAAKILAKRNGINTSALEEALNYHKKNI